MTWRRVETVQVVNALTGDVVEFICDGGTNESDDILLGIKVEAFSSWQKKLYDNGDDVLTLLPDEWAAFYAETWSTFGDELQDSNGPRKPEGFEQELATQLQALVELHEGLDNGGKGIEASDWEDVRKLLAEVKAEVAL